MRILYKLFTPEEWQGFQRSGRFVGSEVDRRDGFIHFSYADQVVETARKHFAGKGTLVLAAVSPEGLEAHLRNEASRGGALFPHLYSALCTENIVWTREITPDASGVPVLGVLPDKV